MRRRTSPARHTARQLAAALGLFGVAAGCASKRGSAQQVPAASPDVDVQLAAACADDATVASMLEVTVTSRAPGRPVFAIATQVMGQASAAARLREVSARDARGPIALERHADDGRLTYATAVDAVGAVTLRYRVASIATDADGPREGLRHDATGIGGLGDDFLLLPDWPGDHRVRVAWGAARCPPDAVAPASEGATSLGAGSAVEVVAPLDEVSGAIYLWGRPARHDEQIGDARLEARWYGAPAFDTATASAWAARVWATERAFFGDTDATPYRLFVRVLAAQGERANGIGRDHAMLSAIGPRTPLGRRLRTNLAHEMLHRWIGLRIRLDVPEGEGYWFSEGFTVYYAAALSARASLIDAAELRELVDDLIARHQANPRRDARNAEIARDFFTDPDVSIVPYTRGALYAAELDRALCAASAGTTSLDDLMRALSAAAVDGRPVPGATIRAWIERALGPAGVTRFDAVIERGEAVDVAAVRTLAIGAAPIGCAPER